jgi:4-hydroxybenzoate polyprenyltransferase
MLKIIVKMKIKILILLLSGMQIQAFNTISSLTMIKHNNNINFKPVHKHKLNSYFKLTRPEGLAYEFALPLFGSYLATKNIATSVSPSALLIAFITTLVASNSMVINDYYDYKSGTDNLKDSKILNKKILTSEEVLYFSMYLALTCYYLTSLVNNNIIRNIISNTIILTYLYTPVLKNIPFVKNIVVAFIVAQAPLVGGLAVSGNIYYIKPAIVYLFNFIMWQELMLDIMDMEGDKKNNIKTIPVIYGYKNANIIGILYLLLGTLLPYGLSLTFILLQSPIILINIYALRANKILKKTALKLSKVIMLFSGIYMSI